MTITLTVSEIRQALLQTSQEKLAGDGAPSTKLLGSVFHRLLSELLREDSANNLESIVRDLDADLQEWKRTLLDKVYDQILGPLLTSNSAALRDCGAQIIDLWTAVQEAVDWLAEVWWEITAAGTNQASQRDWFWVERPVVLDLRQSNWTEPVALIGQTDAVLRHPKSQAWCVLEWKIGQTTPVVDLAQACLYHLMLTGTNPARSASALAVVSFLPKRQETLFQSDEISKAQTALLELIGKHAGVTGQPLSATVSLSPAASSSPVVTVSPAITASQVVTASQAVASELQESRSDLTQLPGNSQLSAEWLEETRDQILRVLRKFGVPCRETKPPVIGPSFVRFSVFPDRGIRQKKILSGAPDLHLHLGLSAEPVMSVIDGSIAIDLPNPAPAAVTFDDLRPALPPVDRLLGCAKIPVGLDITRTLVWCDLAASESPHMLVVGTSGSGKSQWLRSTVASLIASNSPQTLQLLIIDPKQNAFPFISGSPFLRRPIIVPDGDLEVSEILAELVQEMEDRYFLFSQTQSQSLSEHVQKVGQPMARVICICDEYADLLEGSDRTERQAIEKQLKRISAKGRAAGIHLILATQQPRANVVTSAIRAMLPAKVALRVADARESRIAIEESGAERLLGNGDLLFRCIGTQRLQGAWLPEDQAVALMREANLSQTNGAIRDESA